MLNRALLASAQKSPVTSSFKAGKGAGQSMEAPQDKSELDKSIAERRKKREKADSNRMRDFLQVKDVPQKAERQNKSRDRGWYRVEKVVGHRLSRVKNKE